MLIGIAEKGYPQIAWSLSGNEMWRAGQAQPPLFWSRPHLVQL